MGNVEYYVNGYYHVFNRGVDKRKIYIDLADYQRFLTIMEVLNDYNFRPNNSISKMYLELKLPKKPYVRILSYSLMPNHYHFQLEQQLENGMSTFMARLGNSYTKYFNTKYDRKGRLFESSFKSIEITTDDYLLNLTRYIHLNPLDLFEPGWKEKGILNWKRVSKFLENYPWSSYPFYLNKTKDPIVDLGALKEMIKSPKAYIKFMREWTEKSFDLVHPLALL
ncbi:MAG: transposase [Candidatus Uhrbacteria bacterium]|nr:transposase [Patescibacteria group bacterium]MBU1906551.1 transposase [Patescibacteria group bacterium]